MIRFVFLGVWVNDYLSRLGEALHTRALDNVLGEEYMLIDNIRLGHLTALR